MAMEFLEENALQEVVYQPTIRDRDDGVIKLESSAQTGASFYLYFSAFTGKSQVTKIIWR